MTRGEGFWYRILTAASELWNGVDHMNFKRHSFVHRNLRRQLRSNQTASEQALWQRLRGNQLGITFRRQVSLQRYIVDFFASKASLVIEVDGEIHNDPTIAEYDQIRSDYLIAAGFNILRFTNREVNSDIDDVIQRITSTIQTIHPDHNFLPHVT